MEREEGERRSEEVERERGAGRRHGGRDAVRSRGSPGRDDDPCPSRDRRVPLLPMQGSRPEHDANASGRRRQPRLRRQVQPEKVAVLQRLGFSAEGGSRVFELTERPGHLPHEESHWPPWRLDFSPE